MTEIIHVSFHSQFLANLCNIYSLELNVSLWLPKIVQSNDSAEIRTI